MSDFLSPRRLYEWTRTKQGTVRAIERIEEAVPVGGHHHFPLGAVDREIGKDWHLHRVPVVHVVRRELIVPARPLCPYPSFARYVGAGSLEDSANFVCAAAR